MVLLVAHVVMIPDPCGARAGPALALLGAAFLHLFLHLSPCISGMETVSLCPSVLSGSGATGALIVWSCFPGLN